MQIFHVFESFPKLYSVYLFHDDRNFLEPCRSKVWCLNPKVDIRQNYSPTSCQHIIVVTFSEIISDDSFTFSPSFTDPCYREFQTWDEKTAETITSHSHFTSAWTMEDPFLKMVCLHSFDGYEIITKPRCPS